MDEKKAPETVEKVQKVEPRRVFSVQQGDGVGLSAKVVDAHDANHVMLTIGSAIVLVSLADLESARVNGGTFRYYQPDGHGGEVEVEAPRRSRRDIEPQSV